MRVLRAEVAVSGENVARIGPGQATLLAFRCGDGPREMQWMVRKLRALRIFPDGAGRLSLSADALGLAHLVVPQFTLYGTVARGHRPDFAEALPPEDARKMWNAFRAEFGSAQWGVFAADMRVLLENDGPVTILVDSRRDPEEGG